MKRWGWIFSIVVLLAIAASAQQAADPSSTSLPAASQPAVKPISTTPGLAVVPQPSKTPVSIDQVVDAIIEREHALIQFLKNRTPLVETYLQNLQPDGKLGAIPKEDHYFLGRLDLSDIDRRDYLTKEASFQRTLMGGVTKLFRIQYQPMGFSWMIFADRQNFDRAHYDFHYVHREFLGEVRCLVFEVSPKKNAGTGLFQGQIWVEDQDYNIVRLNGTYVPRPRNAFYFHMDSWRLNLVPGYWIPAYIYSEEGDFSYGSRDKLAFKAQSRIWGYDVMKNGRDDELTDLKVEDVKDASPVAQDLSPLEAQRAWQQQAEDNVLERLQKAALLAPAGDVDKVLQTVVNNIQITNNIDLPRPVRARVMVTCPLETFSVGNTIIISRGLIDTLPDEASLAAVLSHELAHIVLGHNLGSKFAFTDRMLFSDESTYQNFGFRHNPEEETAADAKAVELLKNSPYAQKLGSAGLYLKQLQVRSGQMSALLTAHLGNSFSDEKGQIIRLSALLPSAPSLDENKLDQIAALPLGGRIKLDPWGDHVEMIKAAPVSYTSARDKMPFELTPFFPRLARLGAETATAQNTVGKN
ncbi:MAG TPA: M48 family metalloprotease [Terriglobales bacterium]|jgi:Zn-dependent protease with chaperone function|nr:M48 family metalloprotease [Terriglobales bacterium]